MGSRRGICAWCGGELAVDPAKAARQTRVDARYCSKKCRQSAFRLRRRRVADARALEPMTFAYADPPYPGTAKKYYGEEATYAGEVDHAKLISELEDRRIGCMVEHRKIDGWALSTSAKALRDLLPLAPIGARVCAWVKPHGVSGKTFGLHNAWEPLIVVGGRQKRGGVRDWLRAMPARFGGELPGRKPIAFCAWLFDCFGMVPGDTLDDLFPGTGIVSRAWGELASRKYSGDASPSSTRDASLRCGFIEGDSICRLPPGHSGRHDASVGAGEDASPMEDDEALAQQLENLAHDSEPGSLLEAAADFAAPYFAQRQPLGKSPLAELRPAVVFRPVENPSRVQGAAVAPGVAADEVGQESGRSPPTRGEGAEPLRGSE